MTFKIISQKEEPLLARTEVKAELKYEQATPSNAEVAKDIAKATKKDEGLVVIRKIETHYGNKEAEVDAIVYNSEEDKLRVEVKTKAMKEAEKKVAEEATKAKEEAEAAKEAPAEEKAEAPAEEKKEEKTEEKSE